ncbi:hypothetical protein QMT40_001901 [Parvibaculaceae bacterium PLY_AMNH_Bact1]|nr:hypothetical protein QMT40_001901 [Parvibaculaceae bacterium PLY_AMNH_Bact1]
MRRVFRSWIFAGVMSLVAVPVLAGEWIEGAPSSSGRAFAASALLGEEIYIAGGAGISKPVSSVDAYDTIGDIWRALPALPLGLQQAAMASINGSLYASGGYTAESPGPDNAAFYQFDPAVGVWVRGPDMPGARAWHGMVGVNGKLYVVGGVGPRANRVFVFDPMADEWSVQSLALPAERSALALTVLAGEIYAIGGRNPNGSPSARVDILDTSTGKWRRGPALPEARAGIGAAVLEGRIHVVGGEQVSPPRTFSEHNILNSAGTGWESAEPLATPRHGAAVAVAGNRLFAIGGATGPGVFTVFTVSDLVSIYRP